MYYELYEYVSNSQLGALQKALSLTPEMVGLQDIYDDGNLVDTIVTEPGKFNAELNIMTDQKREVLFSQERVDKAFMMKAAVDSDPMFSMLMQDAKMQHVMLRKSHQMNYQGNKFSLPMRCKYDLFRPGDMAIDLKTTACTTYKQFVLSLTHFDYDRQGAVYIDLGRVNRILYVGVSKKMNKRTKKHDVFKYMIERGSDMYISGLNKYTNLAWKYKNYLYDFSPSMPIISI